MVIECMLLDSKHLTKKKFSKKTKDLEILFFHKTITFEKIKIDQKLEKKRILI